MPIQTYVIDFDSTLVTVESLDELANIALEGRPDRESVMARLEEITDQGMSGEIAFDESLDLRLKLFSANRRHIESVASLLLGRISPSAAACHEWFKENAGRIYVISGGFEDYMAPVMERLGLRADHILANRFLYDENGNITGYDRGRPTCQPGGKAKQVEALCLPGPVVVIGDGFTDYQIKASGSAQEFWAFTETVCRDAVITKADSVLKTFGDIANMPVAEPVSNL